MNENKLVLKSFVWTLLFFVLTIALTSIIMNGLGVLLGIEVKIKPESLKEVILYVGSIFLSFFLTFVSLDYIFKAFKNDSTENE